MLNFKYSTFFFLLLWTHLSNAQVTFPEYNLPLLIVETPHQGILDEPKITARLKVIDNGPGQSNRPEDEANGYDGWIGIEKRGQSSQFFFEKVGYGFETRLEDGSNNNVELLGLPKENDWVLHGPFSDKTLMRNALAYRIGEKLMDYAPRTRFVELIIDGDYRGVYLLLEKIKRDKNRVDIANLKPEDIEGDQLTGGYILKIDKLDSPTDGFLSEHSPLHSKAGQSITIAYHDPKLEELKTEQKDYIQNWMAEFEDVLNGENFKDPIQGYPAYIDESSFINYFLVNELTRNPDAYRISTYLYKDRDSLGGKLHMGPIWDFNLAFGNVNFCLGPSPYGWVKDYNKVCPEDFWLIPFWWERLLQDTTFGAKVRDRWVDLRQNELSDVNVLGQTAAFQLELANAIDRNFIRWPILDQQIWPNPAIHFTYTDELNELLGWLQERLNWIDNNIGNLARPPYNSNAYFDPIVFPNPSQDEIWLKFYALTREKVNINVYDGLGRLVYQTSSEDHLNGENIIPISPGLREKGNYFYGVWYDSVLKSSGSFQLY